MLRASGLLTLAGVATTIAGVSVCAKAGDLREGGVAETLRKRLILQS